MEKFIISGRRELRGEIEPSGNKNEALPALAAALLADGDIILNNVPDIRDIKDIIEIIGLLGSEIEPISEHSWKIRYRHGSNIEIDFALASRIRGSILLIAPLLFRWRKVLMPYPGGDKIGIRHMNTNLAALQAFGVNITHLPDSMEFSMSDGLIPPADIVLEEASVTATETALLMASVANGQSSIYNAACEPHVQGLCHMLNGMGAKISGIGTNLLHIEGATTLKGFEHTISPDHIEVGSLIGLAASTGGELLIKNAGNQHTYVIRAGFKRLGINTIVQDTDLYIPKEQSLKIIEERNGGITKIDDGIWPAIPSDLTSIFVVVATQCSGTLIVFEKMFENRLYWVDRLISMNARIIVCDPHRVVIGGPSPLFGRTITTPDIRAGMGLIIAACCAQGTSEIYAINQIDRGYEALDKRLAKLGVDINRVSA